MLILKVLLVRLRIRHLGLAHGTHMDECLLCCLLLVIGAVALLLLHLRAFLGRLSLGLYLLLSTSHRGKNSDAYMRTVDASVSSGAR